MSTSTRRLLAALGLAALVVGMSATTSTAQSSTMSAAHSATAEHPESQSGSLTWQPEQRVNPNRGVLSMSCVSKTLCRAGDASDQVLRWDGYTWQNGFRFPSDAAGIDAISCPTTTFCGAMETIYTSHELHYRPVTRNTDGTWNLSAAQVALPTMRFPGNNASLPYAISCTSASFCMLVTAEKGYQVWNGKTWSAPVVFQHETQLRASEVSCASPTSCVVVGDTWVGFSSAPGKTVYRWNGSSWSKPQYVDLGNFIHGLSCPTTTFCMLTNGSRYVTIRGSQISSIKRPPIPPYGGLSCTSATFCLATGGGGSMRWDGTRWSGPHKIAGDPVLRVSCSSPSFCVAFTAAKALDRVDGTWQAPRTMQDGTIIYLGGNVGALPSDVSCGSPTLCVLADNRSAALAYDGTSWSGPHTIKPLTARVEASCVSTAFCAAATGNGGVQFRRDGHWTAPVKVLDTPYPDTAGLSCASPTFCAITDGAGTLRVWNGTTWSTVPDPSKIYFTNALSCAADGCVMTAKDTLSDAKDVQTYVYRVSTETLEAVGSEIPAFTALSCTSLTFCLSSGTEPGYDAPGNVVEQFDGTSWSDAVTADGAVTGAGVSCTSPTFCVVVGGRWESTWDGSQLSAEQRILDAPLPQDEYLDAVSCQPGICAAITNGSWAVVAQ